MSTLTSHSSAPAARRKASPVTAHPWFPGLVALWFAALLGLSAIVVAPAMLERLVAASRIDMFVAAAAPPLGQTARLLVALGLTGLGGLFGLILGRLIAARSKRAARGLDVVYAPSDELIDDEEPAEAPVGLRDRLARLTGQGDGPRDFDDLPKLRSRDRHPDAPGRKPLSPSEDLAADSDDACIEDMPVADIASIEPEIPPSCDSRPKNVGFGRPPFSSPDSLAEEEWPAPGPFAEPHEMAEVAEISAPEADEPFELDRVVAEEAPILHGTPPSPPSLDIGRAALDSLGVVQLTERLALSMQARRERNARRAAAKAAAAAMEEPPITLPSLSSVRPLAAAPAPIAPANHVSDDAALNREALEGGYSSLVGLSRKAPGKGPVSAPSAATPAPFAAPSAAAPLAANAMNGADAGKTDETEAPSHFRPSDPAEAYRALKSALDSIQRISGTG